MSNKHHFDIDNKMTKVTKNQNTSEIPKKMIQRISEVME